MINRATGDNQSAQSEEEGLEPPRNGQGSVDEIIAEEFASPDLELVWEDEDTDLPGREERIAFCRRLLRLESLVAAVIILVFAKLSAWITGTGTDSRFLPGVQL
jgi:hypothetical protein